MYDLPSFQLKKKREGGGEQKRGGEGGVEEGEGEGKEKEERKNPSQRFDGLYSVFSTFPLRLISGHGKDNQTSN